jgi:hypothetical protein
MVTDGFSLLESDSSRIPELVEAISGLLFNASDGMSRFIATGARFIRSQSLSSEELLAGIHPGGFRDGIRQSIRAEA